MAFVSLLLEKGKHVVVCGLDGDYKRQKFGTILDLVPMCDRVKKLTAVCALCRGGNARAVFTLRHHYGGNSEHKDEQIVIGGEETYKPVCRRCYELATESAATSSPS